MDKDQLDHLRHSAAHLLAAAVMELWPDTKRTIGPAIANGFYYDFEFSQPLSEMDLLKIEKRMHKILPTWKKFEKQEVSAAEAKKEYADNPYKLELIEEFSREGQKLTFYNSGQYSDLCRGGHCEHPDKELAHFKLLSIAGAYWRGDEKNKMLTRIYGTAFPNQEELDQYLKMIEEAKLRDHRKLGKELDLFTFSELVGSGLPLFTPRGTFIRQAINDYVEEKQVKKGYEQVWTPQMVKAKLFQVSGHYDKYKDDMFKVVSNYSKEEFYLKPMNCPQHTQIYASQPRSYRDLPLRYSDFAMLYRDEKPGELNGLARVRSFSQDDCHIFCREDQVDQEIDQALTMTKEILETFGLSYRYRLSTRDLEHPEKYLGDPQIWDKVEKWAEQIMIRNKIEYFPGPGEAAFYAPKMDLIATDALGREWQLSTMQIDYVMPERFGLEYNDKDGQKKRPIMLHRAIVGSSERLMMILIEHFAGNFPLWLSPVQIKIMTVSETHSDFAKNLATEFRAQNIRVEVDDSNETLGNKIRKNAKEKIPYTLVIGDKEMASDKLAVRVRGQEKLWEVDKTQFIKNITASISERKLDL